MKRFIIKFICVFIPNIQLRMKIRNHLIEKFITNSTKNNIEELKKITSILNKTNELPTSSGILRNIQLATIKMLIEVDKLCKKHNIKYWLSFGSLIGAVRNNHYIPWDDDIDISMLREDYKKFISIFKKEGNENFYIDFIHTRIAKIHHKKIKSIFIDIFPCDIYYKETSLIEKYNLSKQIRFLSKNTRKNLPSKLKKNIFYEYNDIFEQITKQKIPYTQKNNIKNPTIFYSIDFNHTHDYIAFDYNTIFPLKTIEFENYQFPCPNDTDTYLTLIYKDYMAFPKHIHYHIDINKLPMEEVIALQNYIKE